MRDTLSGTLPSDRSLSPSRVHLASSQTVSRIAIADPDSVATIGRDSHRLRFLRGWRMYISLLVLFLAADGGNARGPWTADRCGFSGSAPIKCAEAGKACTDKSQCGSGWCVSRDKSIVGQSDVKGICIQEFGTERVLGCVVPINNSRATEIVCD